jgi:hypothetical protein
MHARARHWARGALALVLPLTLWAALAGPAQALQAKAAAPQALASAGAVAKAAGVTTAQRKTTIGTTVEGLVLKVTMPAVEGPSKGGAYDR